MIDIRFIMNAFWYSRSYETSEPSQVTVDLDSDQLKEDISEWGGVSTDDGFQCCLMDTSNLQNPQPLPNESGEGVKTESQIVPTKISAVCEVRFFFLKFHLKTSVCSRLKLIGFCFLFLELSMEYLGNRELAEHFPIP